jgi:hypothetical protein
MAIDPVSLTMGGLSLVQGVFSALGASKQAEAQYQAQLIQQRNENFRNKWQTEAQNRNQLRQYQAALERNVQVEQAANKERAIAEVYLDRNFQNQKGTLSKQTNLANAAFLTAMQGKGISGDSGTARALFRQNMEALGKNMLAMKTTYRNAYRDIETQQAGRLAQRADTMFPNQVTYLPSTGGIVNSASSALTTGLISAGIQGFAAGYQAELQYGGGGGGGGGNGSDASLSASQLAARQAIRGF